METSKDPAMSKSRLGRGAFILLEGVDRCGKTTQAKLLVEMLKKTGQSVCFMRFPGERLLLL